MEILTAVAHEHPEVQLFDDIMANLKEVFGEDIQERASASTAEDGYEVLRKLERTIFKGRAMSFHIYTVGTLGMPILIAKVGEFAAACMLSGPMTPRDRAFIVHEVGHAFLKFFREHTEITELQ